MLNQSNPIHLRIEDVPNLELLKSFLTYKDKSVDFAIRKLKKAHWYDPEAHQEKLDELLAERNKCLLFQDDDGFYTLSGLRNEVSAFFKNARVTSAVKYPKYKTIPWEVVPPPLRDYQEKAKENLLAIKHGAVEIGTGLGKSFIIMHLVKTIGLKAVVMCPSTSIADQLLSDFTKYLGKKRVGQFYGGKKDSKKLVTIAIHASLARIEKGSEHWKNLSQADVFIADESHLTPAATLHEVCIGLHADAPYRFFFSGTQVRGDGAELLLRGIIGPIVYKMTVEEGVEKGWLARPAFRVLQVISNSNYDSDDANKLTREHLFYNPVVNQKVAQIANAAVANGEGPVLILVDEIEQFSHIEPLLRFKCAFAYGTLTPANQRYVQDQYRQNDNVAIVKDFNDGKIPILIGTSAISIGTDIRAVKTGIYVRGGKSPIDVPQSVGRCTRLFPGKDSFTWIDFDVTNVDTLHRHAEARIDLYNAIYPDVEVY